MTTLQEQLRATWDLFYHPSGVIEVRAIVDGKGAGKAWVGWGKTVTGYFDDPEAFMQAMIALDNERSVKSSYVTLNPVLPALMSRASNRLKAAGEKDTTTSDADIILRHRLLIDADPYRPANISSTDKELAAARAKRDEVVNYLRSLGAPPMALADSGNGAHALPCIDLPNTPESTQLASDFLQGLNLKLGTTPEDKDKARQQFAAGVTTVGIDVSVFNAARITKLYGSVARKGDNTQDRPHRRAQLTFVPDSIEPLPVELIKQVAQEYRDHVASKQKGKAEKGKAGRKAALQPSSAKTDAKWSDTVEGVEGWFAEHGVTLGARHAYSKDGFQHKWDVDCLTCAGVHKDGAIVMWGAGKGLGYRCHHDSCTGKGWADVRAIIAPKPEGNYTGSRVDMWMGALDDLGHDIKLNLLEDTIEIDGSALDDVMRSKITLDLYDSGVTKAYIDDLLNVVAARQAYHPVQQYLNGLQWDGHNHLGDMLACFHGDDVRVRYKQAELPLHHALIPRWLLGCVARGLDGDSRKPFKHQTPMLVIIGKQGLGKSSWVKWLVSGIGYGFHCEGPIDPHSTDDKRKLVTRWLWEVSELGSSLRKADRDALKGLITQELHTYRKPYGRSNITKPTLCNLVGTLNPEVGFLDDPTGHRRFLPVRISSIDRVYGDIDVNQLWAQVVHLYRNGETPELAPCEREAIAQAYQQHEVENPLQTYLQMYFDIEPGRAEWRCFTAEIAQRLQAFGVNVSLNAKVAGREINDALAPMDLERKYLSIGGVKGWGWLGIKPNGR